MDYSNQYRKKLTTPEEAVKVVKSGDWVDYGWATSNPVALDKALAARYQELKDVKFRSGIVSRMLEIFKVPDMQEHFIWNSWHCSGIERKLCGEGKAFYIPVKYSEMPRIYRKYLKVNVAMMQVAPMDENGFFNFGPNASHMKAVCEVADVIIVEVNRAMPYCLGGGYNGVHIDDVDMIVESDCTSIPAIGGSDAPPSEVDTAVANLVVPEIPDGACLQLGIGGMPNAIGKKIAESDLKHLGVQTVMYVDAFVDLTLAGKIDGSRKNLDRGKQTYCFGLGSKKMYDFLDHNPACAAAPVDYTNDVRIVAMQDNFISINNAIDVDLFGQINAESSGTRHISGAGGQLDFVIGAYLSNGGKSFMCLSSTFQGSDGLIQSRIRPKLKEGSIVTDTRANAHYLVTEYGMVNLKGLSMWERTEGIISIAHPDFRDQLIREADKMKIWRRSNKIR